MLNSLLAIPFLFLLLGSILLTIKTRFVQFRSLPVMFSLLYKSLLKKDGTTQHTIKPHRALFTAMATSLGIGNIVAPIVAISFGGPGALLGFLLATIFGTATAYTEVSLAITSRKKLPDGKIMGGPMQYLRSINPWLAFLYAASACVMLVSWSGKQANTLATLLSAYSIPTYLTGIIIAIIVSLILNHGIKLIGKLAEKVVPIMFFLYAGSMLWIIGMHADKLLYAVKLVFFSAFSPQALAGAGVGVGLQAALSWGLSEAAFANEAGVGTITIPHSMSASENPIDQGILSMLSVYTSGFLCMLSGLALLVSGAWQTSGSDVGITVLATMLRTHFATLGPFILLLCVILFAFSATLGNSYNGSQCFLYVTKNRWLRFYHAFIALAIFFSAILDVKTLWSLGGYFIVPVAIPNIIGIVILSFKRGKIR